MKMPQHVTHPSTTSGDPLIVIKDLVKRFPIGSGLMGALAGNSDAVHAVNGISLTIKRGEVIGIAGESGCGKSTTAKLLMKSFEPTSGTITIDGDSLNTMKGATLKQFRRRAQLIFQNPYESLNPRFTIRRALLEPLIIHGVGTPQERLERVMRAMHDVHLRPQESYLDKLPHQLSGGQLQRVVLARALVLDPDILVADEPVSMLDVSVRAGIMNTMRDLAAQRGLTVVYISHDLSFLQYLCDTTAIMYLGHIVEIGPTRSVIQNPQHPYTRALIATIPVPEPGRPQKPIPIRGGVPSSIHIPSGCPFHTRCPYAMEVCPTVMPPEVRVNGISVRCYLHTDAKNSPRLVDAEMASAGKAE
jgi:oligopeptide/dipeptide ABC transporter ATP-binding protein